MFDIGWTEVTIIIIVAIIVIGPKDLPRVLRTVGEWVGKAKSLTREFRGHVDDFVRETELEDIKKQIEQAGDTNLESLVEDAVDLDDEVKDAMNFDGEEFTDYFDDGDGASEKNTDEPEETIDAVDLPAVEDADKKESTAS